MSDTSTTTVEIPKNKKFVLVVIDNTVSNKTAKNTYRNALSVQLIDDFLYGEELLELPNLMEEVLIMHSTYGQKLSKLEINGAYFYNTQNVVKLFEQYGTQQPYKVKNYTITANSTAFELE